MAGKWRFNPCSECCHVDPCCCVGTPPAEYQVVIAGVIPSVPVDYCLYCDDINTTYVLSLQSGETCIWEYSGDSPCTIGVACSLAVTLFWALDENGKCVLNVSLLEQAVGVVGQGGAYWKKTYDMPPD